LTRISLNVYRGATAQGLGLVPFCGRDGGYVEVLGVLEFDVRAKRFIKRFVGLSLSTRSIGHSLFDADDLTALRALAEAMTGAIHFVFWPKPTYFGQFWLFDMPSVSHRPHSLASGVTRSLA
jgi:hypothetical protein